MPLGTGNDLCNSLGFGTNLGINYLHKFFDKLNNKKSKIIDFDTWNFEMYKFKDDVKIF